MPAIVLLVTSSASPDDPSPLATAVREATNAAGLGLEIVPRGDHAIAWLEGRLDGDLSDAPATAIVDVDVVKGWNVCALMKKAAPAIPVLVVSHKFGQEVFAEHQKLETRADAYHRLPSELDALVAGLRLHLRRDNPEPRTTSRAQRADAALSRLEQRSLEQEREIERLRQTIEALEVERDAVAENARRQLAQLATDVRAPSPPPLPVATGGDDLPPPLPVGALDDDLPPPPPDSDDFPPPPPEPADEDLLAELDATRAELQARELAWASERAVLQVEAARGRDGAEGAEDEARRTAETAADELARASEQLGNLAVQFAGAHRERIALRADKLKLEARLQALEAEGVSLAERLKAREAADRDAPPPPPPSSGRRKGAAEPPPPPGAAPAPDPALADLVTALEAQLAERDRELAQLLGARRDAEHALATSRKLMREYASEASRKTEELREATAHVLELEETVEAALGHIGVLEAQVEAMSAAPPPPPEPAAVALEAELADLRQTLADAIMAHAHELAASRATAEQALEAARAAHEQAVATAKADAEQAVATAKADAEQAVATAKADAEQAVATAKADAEQAVAANPASPAAEAQLSQVRDAWTQLVEEFGAVLNPPRPPSPPVDD